MRGANERGAKEKASISKFGIARHEEKLTGLTDQSFSRFCVNQPTELNISVD